MNSELDNSYSQFSYVDCLNNLNDFDNLINWLSNEFILCLQEENQRIKVYFPNGWFIVKLLKENNNKYKIQINSKSKFTFTKIKEQLLLAITRFKHIRKSYSYEQLSY
mgnify:CR=1 FL=1